VLPIFIVQGITLSGGLILYAEQRRHVIIAGCGKVMISISIGSQNASQARWGTKIKSLRAIRKKE